MSAKPSAKPIRRGRPLCVSVDPDADSLLRSMVPNKNGLGLFVSELIRREAQWRETRPETLTRLAAQADKDGER